MMSLIESAGMALIATSLFMTTTIIIYSVVRVFREFLRK